MSCEVRREPYVIHYLGPAFKCNCLKNCEKRREQVVEVNQSVVNQLRGGHVVRPQRDVVVDRRPAEAFYWALEATHGAILSAQSLDGFVDFPEGGIGWFGSVTATAVH